MNDEFIGLAFIGKINCFAVGGINAKLGEQPAQLGSKKSCCDRNLNGIFGEPSIGFLAVTKGDHRSLGNRTSYFQYQKPTLTLGTKEFKVTDIKPNGTAIRLEKTE